MKPTRSQKRTETIFRSSSARRRPQLGERRRAVAAEREPVRVLLAAARADHHPPSVGQDVRETRPAIRPFQAGRAGSARARATRWPSGTCLGGNPVHFVHTTRQVPRPRCPHLSSADTPQREQWSRMRPRWPRLSTGVRGGEDWFEPSTAHGLNKPFEQGERPREGPHFVPGSDLGQIWTRAARRVSISRFPSSKASNMPFTKASTAARARRANVSASPGLYSNSFNT